MKDIESGNLSLETKTRQPKVNLFHVEIYMLVYCFRNYRNP